MKNNWTEKGREVLAIEIEGLESVSARLGSSFDQAVNMIGACSGRVIVTGIGKSGLVGHKIAATLSSTGTPAFFLHPVEGLHGDLGIVREGDVAIAISYSGRTQELNTILPVLRSLGVGIVAITSGLESPLAAAADIVLDVTVPREACSMNLAPTTSTTATLAMGDALAVCLTELKQFTDKDFKKYHPGGALGERLLLSAKDIMITNDVPTVRLEASQKEALTMQDQRKLGAVVILEGNGKVAGILTDGDVRRAACRGLLEPGSPVSTIMTANPRCCFPEDSAAELLDIMEEKMITVLPVLTPEGTLAGIVHMHDLLGKGTIKFTE